MYKPVLVRAFLLLFISASLSGQKGNDLIIGRTDSLYSKELNEYRKIIVHIPLDKPDEYSLSPKYPVIYVFDGEYLFLPVVSISELLGGGGGNYMFPKCIVVGIVNTDRTRDLTPTHSVSSVVNSAVLLANSGGGKQFNTFLEKELIPYIDSVYPAAPYRMIIGHSLGGLATIDLMLNRSQLFNSYVAIDPSLWWDNQSFLKQARTVLEKADLGNRSLYLAIANTMGNGMSPESVARDTAESTLPMRSVMEFKEYLGQNRQTGLNFRTKFYSDYDHGSVGMVAIYDALPFIFSFWPADFPFNDFFRPSYKNDSILIHHYENVSSIMTYKVTPPGDFVDAIAHKLLDSKQYKRALGFFTLNIQNYPLSYKPYDSMGDFYLASGDSKKAAEYYNKALSVKDNPVTWSKLRELWK